MSFFSNLFKKRPTLDPEMFGDNVAFKTNWHPLKHGGANFKTHKLVFEESLNNVLCNWEPEMSCYLDKKFKKEVPHLSKHKPFQTHEVIQLPSPKYPGEFKDTVIRHDCKVERIYKVTEIKNGYQIDFSGVTIFIKKEDFEIAVPEWVKLLLVEKE